jgi:predicted hydrocarbon binding protein
MTERDRIDGVDEELEAPATVKGTMLAAHLEWARERFGDLGKALTGLSPEAARLVGGGTLSTDWVALAHLVEIDKAIASRAGGDPEETFLELGRHSARKNLSGVYRSFISSEPHRFFEKSSLLHDRFQSFGNAVYERTGERSGRMAMESYRVCAPSYCAAGRGYFEEALELLHAPGPILVREVSCRCRGQERCVYDMAW